MNIIKKEVEFFIFERNINLKMIDHIRMNELFSNKNKLFENENDRNNVISLIKNNQWEEPNPKIFRESLSKSKHKLMLTDYTETELSNMKLFKLKGYDIGFALKNNEKKPYSEIVAVFNNEPNISNIGNYLMQAAIDNGGCYLDHFDTEKLSTLYKSIGFEEYDRFSYDPQYDPNGQFRKKYGEVDVIFRKHKSC